MAKTGTSAPTSAQRKLAAQRAAAARERIAAAQRRRRLLVVGSAIGVIVVVVAVLVVVRVAVGSGGKSGTHRTAAQASVATQLANVPASEFDKIGVGAATSGPTSNNKGPILTGPGGIPRVLFVGAEFCPYCAAERWGVAVALSRFGTLHGLGEVRSSPSDYAPNTATLSFHDSSYTSKYIAFTGKELQSNQVVDGQYGPLDTLSGVDKQVFAKLGKGYPFLDVGGKFVANSPSYDPKLLQGKNQQQIAAAIHDTSSPIAQAVVGSANVVSARICQVDHDQPAAVCSSSGVKAAASALAKSSS